MKTCISIASSTMKVDSFYKYSIAQLQSMRENAEIDTEVVFWYDELNVEQLGVLASIWEDIKFEMIDHDKYRKYNKFSAGWFCLEGWTLTDYDRVIIMDSDFICQGSLKGLLNENCDIGMVKEWTGIYNGGLVTLSKKFLQSDWYQKMMEVDPSTVKIGGNRDQWSKDQKLYNYYFKNEIKALDHNYNWLVSERGAVNAKMIHYIYKPLYHVGRAQLVKIDPELVNKWEKYYRRGCETAGIQAEI